MTYDAVLADRLREALAGEPAVDEKRMFGGLAFLVHGHLTIAASGRGGLLVRCPPGDTAALSAEPGVGPMAMRGRETAGWLHVAAARVAGDDALRRWVEVGLDYVRGLPAKGG